LKAPLARAPPNRKKIHKFFAKGARGDRQCYVFGLYNAALLGAYGRALPGNPGKAKPRSPKDEEAARDRARKRPTKNLVAGENQKNCFYVVSLQPRYGGATSPTTEPLTKSRNQNTSPKTNPLKMPVAPRPLREKLMNFFAVRGSASQRRFQPAAFVQELFRALLLCVGVLLFE